MKFIDHYYLCKYLCGRYEITGIKKTVVCMGGLEPDVSIYSFFKGICKGHAFGAHSWIYIEEEIENLCCKLDKTKWGSKDFFLYGRLTHFLADAFTRPHNVHYKCLVHKAYELKKLHPLILDRTKSAPTDCSATEISTVQSLVFFITARHTTYCDSWTKVLNDLENIFYVNETVQDWFAERLSTK